MKILSDNAVTKADLNAVDAKQSRQIMQLRIAVAVSFGLNLLAAVLLRFA
jgi:hypothetical protein